MSTHKCPHCGAEKPPLPPHPMEPVVIGGDGFVCFRGNEIVKFLLGVCRARNPSIALNELALMPFSSEDRQHFLQLIGYSVSGFCECSCVDPNVAQAANELMEKLIAKNVEERWK